jgi:hypothetical protein
LDELCPDDPRVRQLVIELLEASDESATIEGVRRLLGGEAQEVEPDES